MKTLSLHFLIGLVLLCNAACARQADVARRDYILGGDHGWIDLVLGPSTKGEQCGAVLSVNGEQMLVIPEPAAAAGYRIPVPVGRLDLELRPAACGAAAPGGRLVVEMGKDRLAQVQTDGKSMTLKSMADFAPTTLEWMRTEVLKLQAENAVTARSVDKLINISIAILGVNCLLLVGAMLTWRRRRHPV